MYRNENGHICLCRIATKRCEKASTVDKHNEREEEKEESVKEGAKELRRSQAERTPSMWKGETLKTQSLKENSTNQEVLKDGMRANEKSEAEK